MTCMELATVTHGTYQPSAHSRGNPSPPRVGPGPLPHVIDTQLTSGDLRRLNCFNGHKGV